MFFDILLLLFLTTTMYGSEGGKELSGKTVNIHFLDSDTGEYPLEFVMYSQHLQHMIEGAQESEAEFITLNTIEKKNFDYLIDIIKQIWLFSPKIEPLAYEKIVTLFINALSSNIDKHTVLKQLLINANFLDVPFKLKRALVYAYVKTCDTKNLPITVEESGTQKIISFDGLPQELGILIAGWFLYFLLTEKEWNDLELLFKKSIPADMKIYPVQISNPAAQHMFALLWPNLTGNGSSIMQQIQINTLEVSLTTLKLNKSLVANTTIEMVEKKFVDSIEPIWLSQCALSNNGEYLLVTGAEVGNGDENESAIVCAYLFPGGQKIQFNEQKKDFIIDALLFNQIMGTFTIIARKNLNSVHKYDSNSSALVPFVGQKRESLCIYEIDPKTKEITGVVSAMSGNSENILKDVELMSWSYIGKHLLGAYYDNRTKDWDVIVYNSEMEEFFSCNTDQEGDWFYKTNDDKKYPLNCTIDQLDIKTKKQESTAIIFSSFIPYFETVLKRSYIKIIAQTKYLYKDIDWKNFRVNFYTKYDAVGMYYFFPPLLSDGLILLNDRVHKGNSATVLVDAILLILRYKYPKEWGTLCKEFISYGSPEIRELLNKSTAVVVPQARSIPPQQQRESFYFLKSLKQNIGQFWATPRHYLRTVWSQYQKTIRTVGTVFTVGVGAWIMAKYAIKRYGMPEGNPR